MLYVNYLFILVLISVVITINGDLSSEELEQLGSGETADFIKTMIALGYEADRLTAISDIAQEFSSSKQNITIVGKQNIHNDDGSIKEVRAISLYLPTLDKSDATDDSDKEDDSSAEANYDELTKLFDSLSRIGLPMQVSYVEYDNKNDNKPINMAYIDKDNQYFYDKGMGYLNKTIGTSNPSIMDQKIKSLEEEVIPTAILKYDSDSNFQKNDSKVVPELYVYINDEENTPPEILQTIINGLGIIGVQNLKTPDLIPQELGMYLKDTIPNYIFHITSEPDGYYINKDIYIEANFEHFYIGVLEYYIFGVEKSKS